MSEHMYRVAVSLVMTGVFAAGVLIGHVSDEDATATPTPAVRELRCEEDEEIVTTLGDNGLPYAFCLQAIER